MEDTFRKRLFIGLLTALFFILFLLISILNLLSSKKNQQSQKSTYPSPTSFSFSPYQQKNDQKDQNKKITPQPAIPAQFTGVKEEKIPKEISDDANQSFDLRNKLPLENEYFMINYDYKNDNFVVFLKNNSSPDIFFQWLEKNYPGIKKERIKFSNQPIEIISPIISPTIPFTPTKTQSENEFNQSLNLTVDLLKIISNQLPQTTPSNYPPTLTITPSSNIANKLPFNLNTTPPPLINNYIYFSQSCYGINSQYCQLPLPGGCTLSEAGCGPTTVTMIIANLTNYKNITPPEIVKQYSPAELGCDGSGYLKAKQILEKYGLRTGNLIVSFPYRRGKPVDEVVNQLKKYQSQSATFFTLTAFKQSDGDYIGHFFWIVNIDSQNNIWSLDPYYGRNNIPYNQNTRYPDPLYEVIFPVYKN